MTTSYPQPQTLTDAHGHQRHIVIDGRRATISDSGTTPSTRTPEAPTAPASPVLDGLQAEVDDEYYTDVVAALTDYKRRCPDLAGRLDRLLAASRNRAAPIFRLVSAVHGLYEIGDEMRVERYAGPDHQLALRCAFEAITRPGTGFRVTTIFDTVPQARQAIQQRMPEWLRRRDHGKLARLLDDHLRIDGKGLATYAGGRPIRADGSEEQGQAFADGV